ncbi:MAG: SDR family oxidoreductase [Spirochaetota bacterium]|nr:MAG: SDR family oxidoreductase [Spirochaetota bacterium]
MKKMLITGASTGIDAQTAIELSPDTLIFVHYNRSKSDAQKVAEKVNTSGGKAALVQADLMTEEGCDLLYKKVSEQTDSLDILVNNAGGLIKRAAVDNLQWDSMIEIFFLNTFLTMLLTKLCIPLLKKANNPVIINITSLAIRNGAPTATIYGAAKGAIDSFTRGAARELAPKIRVNAIAPGVIETPFHDKFTSKERLKLYKDNTPLKCFGTSDQIAKTIRFIIENEFMTGETIDVNGGLFMH